MKRFVLLLSEYEKFLSLIRCSFFGLYILISLHTFFSVSLSWRFKSRNDINKNYEIWIFHGFHFSRNRLRWTPDATWYIEIFHLTTDILDFRISVFVFGEQMCVVNHRLQHTIILIGFFSLHRLESFSAVVPMSPPFYIAIFQYIKQSEKKHNAKFAYKPRFRSSRTNFKYKPNIVKQITNGI